MADAGHDRRRCDVGATGRRGRAVSPSTISVLDTLAGARHADPFSVVGPHLEHRRVVIRAIFPSAASVAVTRPDHPPVEMRKRHPAGIYEAALENEEQVPAYRLRVTTPGGQVTEIDDPYRFG